MYFLFSGEGKTDLGQGLSSAVVCEREAFLPGPMAVTVDQVVEKRHGYSLLDAACSGYVSEHQLAEHAKPLRSVRKKLSLPGKKQTRETRHFYRNASILAMMAMDQERQREDDAVAVLFRDADTASGGRGVWEEKHQSMLDGFDAEGFSRGVPMLPKPTSEAWLLCALKNGYLHCENLENRTGSPKSPNPLKRELAKILGDVDVRDTLCQMLSTRRIDVDRIAMPSYAHFRRRLEAVIV